MNFSFFIAKRYFLTKHNSNVVHIISLISLAGVVVGTAALILVLSVFNGFEQVILQMYNSFDPHLKITSKEGKVFDPVNLKIKHSDIKDMTYVLEEKALLKYQDKEFIATIKGVDSSYKKTTNFEKLLVKGQYIDSYENENVAVLGRGVAYYLSFSSFHMFDHLNVYLPSRSSKTLLNPKTAFNQASVLPVGIFGIQSEIDEQYIITSLSFLQNLASRGNKISAIEIQMQDAKKMLQVQNALQLELGSNFKVQNRLQQQEFLYKMLNTEKLAVFLILTFIIIIAMFNIVGSLSMLILDKHKDIKILKSFGATKSQIKNVFFSKSMFTIIFGILIGIGLGLFIAFLQQHFGLISMGGGNFVVDAYPVKIKLFDILYTGIIVLVVGAISSFYPTKLLANKLFN